MHGHGSKVPATDTWRVKTSGTFWAVDMVDCLPRHIVYFKDFLDVHKGMVKNRHRLNLRNQKFAVSFQVFFCRAELGGLTNHVVHNLVYPPPPFGGVKGTCAELCRQHWDVCSLRQKTRIPNSDVISTCNECVFIVSVGRCVGTRRNPM